MVFFYRSDEVGPPVVSSTYPWRISGTNHEVRVWLHHFLLGIAEAHLASSPVKALDWLLLFHPYLTMSS